MAKQRGRRGKWRVPVRRSRETRKACKLGSRVGISALGTIRSSQTDSTQRCGDRCRLRSMCLSEVKD